MSSLVTANPAAETALELSWQQVFSAVDQLADQFAAQGLQAEDGIGLVGKNSLQLLLCYLAGLSLGARVMVINPQFPSEKIARILQQNQLKFYLASSSLNCDALRLQPSAVQVRDLSCANRTSPRAWQRAYTMTLTSGSSGDPKAVVHNLPAHWQNALGVNAFLRFDSQKSWLLSLPLYHVSGQGIIWRWLSSGACLHFSGEDFYAAIQQTSHASLVPTQLQRYLDYLTHTGQSAVQASKTEAILLGGAPIERALCECAQMVGLTTFSGYGMTEMASTVYVRKNDPQQPEVRLLQGRELTLQAGEIWVRGAGLAHGYWQNGKIVSLLNSAGWYQTKDRGEWQNGELQVLGRIDNLFISGGENIQPEELEAQLLRHPLIEQAVVLPQPDVEFGARPVALLRCSQPFSAELASQVRCWLQDKVERFKQPVAYYPLPEQNDPTQLKISRRQLQQALQRLQQKNDQE
ncbi:o-succinylbenzoate--CoA ligase [Testudinibacter sp. P27/CKL/0425]